MVVDQLGDVVVDPGLGGFECGLPGNRGRAPARLARHLADQGGGEPGEQGDEQHDEHEGDAVFLADEIEPALRQLRK